MDDENKPAEEEVALAAEEVAEVAPAAPEAEEVPVAEEVAPVVDEPVADSDSAPDSEPTPDNSVPESLLDHVRNELHKVATDLGLELEHLKDAFAAKL